MVCIPQRGGTKTSERKQFEKSAAFRKGQRFRAGIEGTISVLFRGRGMKRCPAEPIFHVGDNAGNGGGRYVASVLLLDLTVQTEYRQRPLRGKLLQRKEIVWR